MKQKKSAIIIISIIIGLIIVVGGAILLLSAKSEKTQSPSELLYSGQKYLIDLDYENAVMEFEAVINIEPKNVDAYIGLAAAYIGMGDEEKAIETLEKGISETDDQKLKDKLAGLFEENKPEETTVAETTTTPEVTTSEAIVEIKHPVLKSVNYFNPDSVAYQYGAPVKRVIYIYDDNGIITSESDIYDARGGYGFNYNYDSNGRLESKEQIASWNEPMAKITLAYNDAGEIVSEEYYDYPNFSEYIQGSSKKRYIRYIYDDKNRLKQSEYYVDGKLDYYIVIEYDENNIIKSKRTFDSGGNILVTRVPEYKDGLIIKESKYDSSGKNTEYITYEYDYNTLTNNTYYPHSEWGYDKY